MVARTPNPLTQGGSPRAPASSFAENLADVRDAIVVRESFGWMPSLVGVASLAGAYFLFLDASAKNHGIEDTDTLVSLGALGFGVLCLCLEGFRRIGPTVLVPRGGHLGVYRRGRLEAVIAYANVTHYRLSVLNTIRYLMLPVLVTVGSSIGIFATLGRREAWFFAIGALWGALAIISLVRTRILGRRYFIPKGGRSEEILLARSDAARIFRVP